MTTILTRHAGIGGPDSRYGMALPGGVARRHSLDASQLSPSFAASASPSSISRTSTYSSPSSTPRSGNSSSQCRSPSRALTFSHGRMPGMPYNQANHAAFLPSPQHQQAHLAHSAAHLLSPPSQKSPPSGEGGTAPDYTRAAWSKHRTLSLPSMSKPPAFTVSSKNISPGTHFVTKHAAENAQFLPTISPDRPTLAMIAMNKRF